MKKSISLLLFLLVFSAAGFAQTGPLWSDVLWSAYGAHGLEFYGSSLSYLGAVDTDSVENALAIGADGGAAFILNKTPLDTARQYFANGQIVIPCNLSGTGRGDYVVYNYTTWTVYVLYATSTPFVYDTVLILYDSTRQHYGGLRTRIVVADVDSSDTESLLIFDNFQTTRSTDTSRLLWYTGGIPFDTAPRILPHRISGNNMAVGKVRDSLHQFLCEYVPSITDTAKIYLYPFSRSFDLNPTDSIILRTDSGGSITGGFLLADAFGSGVDDIFLGGSLDVMLFRGGETIAPQPTFIFHPPFDTHSTEFAQKIVNIGHAVSEKYNSILVGDPGAVDGYSGGVFLYNLGNAARGVPLKDTCPAWAEEDLGSDARLGTQEIPIGSYDNAILTNFMSSDQLGYPFPADANGRIFAFLGNAAYKSSVHETALAPPAGFTLSQNYPNPFTGATAIRFAIVNPRLYGASVTMKLYNALGSEVETLYRGRADAFAYTLGVNAGALPAGNYFYRLACGGQEQTKMLTVIR